MNRSSITIPALIIVMSGFVAPAGAATYTWNVSGNGTWTTAANWSGGAPVSNNTNVVVLGGTTSYTVTNNSTTSPFILNSLQFNNTSAGGVTLDTAASNPISLRGTTPTLVQNGTGAAVLNVPLEFNAAGSFTGTGSGTISIGSLKITSGATLTLSNASNVSVGLYNVTDPAGNKTLTNNVTGTGNGLALGGINLGTPTAAYVFSLGGSANSVVSGNVVSAGSFAVSFTKADAGTVTLSGTANTFTGTLQVNNGILELATIGDTGVGANGSGTMKVLNGTNANATLRYVGTGAAITRGLDIFGTGTTAGNAIVENSGSGPLAIGAVSLSAAGAVKTLVLGGTYAGTNQVVGVISNGSGTLGVTKSGAGSWSLAGANTYSGPTVVTGGTLVQGNATAFGSSNAFTVASGAVLDAGLAGIAVTSGGSLIAGRTGTTADDVIGNVSLTGAALNVGGALVATYTHAGNLVLDTSTLVFSLGTASTPGGTVSDLVAVNGNLTLAGTNAVSLTAWNGPLANGSYTLFTYTGTLTGGAGNLAPPTGLTPGRSTYGYDTSSVPGKVLLTVTGQAANLTWIGNGTTNVWDTSTAGAWSGATPDSFFDGDIVAFNDGGSANPLVNIPASVQPFSVTVSSASDYTFTGIGAIAGNTGVTKAGTGTLTLQTANTYTGATTISAGVVRLQNAAALGGAGTATVAAGAAVQLVGGIAYASKPLVLNGNGIANGGALVNVSGNNSWAGAITVASPTRIQSNLNDLSLNGPLTGTGALTLNGPGTITFGGSAGSGFTGTMTVTAGTTVKAGAANALPSGTDVSVLGALDLNGFSQAIKGLNGNGTVTLGTNPSTVLTVNLGNTVFAGVISGSGGLSRVNPGNAAGFNFTLANHNTYTGTTNLQNNNATLTLGIHDALPTGTTLTFLGTTNTNTVLDLNGFNQTVAAITSATTTGTVFIQNNSGAGTSVLTITNGAGAFTATTGSARIRDNDGVAVGGQIALIVTGGTTTFGSTQAYTGMTSITGGTLKGTVADIIATSSSSNVGPAGTFDLNGQAQNVKDLQGSGTVTSTSAAVLTVTTANFGGLISGAVSLTKGNGGTASITGTANTFTGGLTVNNGTLEIYSLTDAGAGSNGMGAIKILNGNNAAATLRYLGAAATTSRAIDVFANGAAAGSAAIDASGTGALVFNGGASRSDASGTGLKLLVLTGTNIADNTFGGTIANGSNVLGLSKSGTGTWIIPGTNTYTGPTTVSGGVLRVDGTTGTGATTVTGGIIAGIGTIQGNVTIQAGGTLAPGNPTSPLSTLKVGDATATTPNIAINGILRINFDAAGNSRLATLGNSPGTFDFGSGSQLNLVASQAFQSAFDYSTPRTWSVISLTDGETATGLANPAIDYTAFAPSANLADFSLVQNGNEIILAYTPVPEPIGLIGLAVVVLSLRKKSRRS